MPLPTPDAVRALGLPQLAAGLDDDRVTLLVRAADETLARYCYVPDNDDGAPTLETASYTQYYDGADGAQPRRVTLGLRGVTLTAVDTDTDGDETYGTAADLTDDLVVDAPRGLVYLRNNSTFAWETGLRTNRIQCTAGYDVGATPALALAVALLVAHWSSLASVGTLPQALTQGGQSSTLRSDRLPAAVTQLVSPYRIWERETHWRQG